MNTLAAVLACCLALVVQPVLGQTITYGPLISNISHSSARIVFLTSSQATGGTISWGTSGVYDSSKPLKFQGKTATVVLTGLTANTTYNVMLTAGAASGTAVFTTLAKPESSAPVPPARVNTAMPAGEYYGDLVVSANCSNLPEILTKLGSLTGARHQRVVVPAGTTCVGQYTFPQRSNHAGWVVVTTSSTLPEATRVSPNMAGSLGRFVTNASPARLRAGITSLPNPSTCVANGYYEGGLYHHTSLPGVPLLRCSDAYPVYTGALGVQSWTKQTLTIPGHRLERGMVVDMTPSLATGKRRAVVTNATGDVVTIHPAITTAPEPQIRVQREWRQVPFTQGPFLPATASKWDWFWKTNTGEMYWAMEPNVWQLIAQTSRSESTMAAIIVPSGAARYRFVGLEITGLQITDPMPAGWELPGSTENQQGIIPSLIVSSANDVIWDRCYVHGFPKPSRYHKGISMRGDRTGVIDSYFSSFQEWRGTGYSQTQGSHAIAQYSGGPAVIRNNYLEAAGITYFAPNSEYTDPEVHDVTIENNDFVKRPEWRQTETQPTVYPNRHPIEIKQGRRFDISRNRLTYEWSGILAGASFLVTPRVSAIPAAVTIASVSGGVVTLTKDSHFTDGDVVLITGTNTDHDGLREVQANLGQRTFRLLGVYNGAGGGGTIQNVAPGRAVTDIDIRENVLYQGTEVLRVAGIDSDASWILAPSSRIRLLGNLAVDYNIHAYHRGGRVDQKGTYANGDFGARMVYVLNGQVEDVHVQQNTFYGAAGNMPTLIISTELAGSRVAGLLLHKNIFYGESVADSIRSSSTTKRGRAALLAMFPDVQIVRNVLCCGTVDTSKFGDGFEFPGSVGQIRWVRPSLTQPFDFTLAPDSPYLGLGADTKAFGAVQ